jgi:hypothetical protein
MADARTDRFPVIDTACGDRGVPATQTPHACLARTARPRPSPVRSGPVRSVLRTSTRSAHNTQHTHPRLRGTHMLVAPGSLLDLPGLLTGLGGGPLANGCCRLLRTGAAHDRCDSPGRLSPTVMQVSRAWRAWRRPYLPPAGLLTWACAPAGRRIGTLGAGPEPAAVTTKPAVLVNRRLDAASPGVWATGRELDEWPARNKSQKR